MKKIKRLLIILIIIIAGVCFLYYENNSIEVTGIDLEFQRLPCALDGLKIVQLSDLHSKMFGDNQNILVSQIREAKPDIILFTGDMVDSRHHDEQPVLTLVDGITSLAPIYYVTGNHEFWSGGFGELENNLKEHGVKVLRNAADIFEKNGERIEIIGVDDPVSKTNREYLNGDKIVSGELQKALHDSSQQDFKILLAHRPELISTYASYNVDLIFSGHAHGGQVRFPFIGGLIAPDQGWFPKYTSGRYDEGNSAMVVSRGLGNSIVPQRLFNRPEVVVLRLVRK